MKRLFPFLFLAILVGCASGSNPNGVLAVFKELFTGVHAADAQWEGVVLGPSVGLSATVAGVGGSQLTSLLDGLKLVGVDDPLGVALPVGVANDPVTRWVLCTKAYRMKCQQAQVHARVSFAGKMAGVFWEPSSLSIDNERE